MPKFIHKQMINHNADISIFLRYLHKEFFPGALKVMF